MSEGVDPREVEVERRVLGERVEVLAVFRADRWARPSDAGTAVRDVAREALLRALGVGRSPERLAEVEVLGGRGAPPELRVRGRVADVLSGRNAHVSLTHEATTVAALVVVDGPSPR